MVEERPAPRIVRHPELLDGEPLPLLGGWRWRLGIAAIPVVVLTVLGILSGGSDWTVGLVMGAFWLAYAAVVWGDRRAFLQVVDDQLRVRNVVRMHEVMGVDVRRVVHQFNGKRPDFQLVTERGRVWVPTSRLERGHSTLFTWLDVYAPAAELDERSAYWRGVLDQRELI